MDSPSPSQGFACSASGPKKSPSRKSPWDNYEYFDGYEHDQEILEPKVKIKKKWKERTAAFDEFYDPEIDDLRMSRSYRRKWIPFGSTHKIAKSSWKN